MGLGGRHVIRTVVVRGMPAGTSGRCGSSNRRGSRQSVDGRNRGRRDTGSVQQGRGTTLRPLLPQLRTSDRIRHRSARLEQRRALPGQQVSRLDCLQHRDGLRREELHQNQREWQPRCDRRRI